MSRNIKRRHRTTVARRKASQASVTAESVRGMIGMPVCAVLKDGSVYVGTLEAMENGALSLHGLRSDRKISAKKGKAKAQISMLGLLGSLFGGIGGGAAAGVGAGGFGLGNMGNLFKIGLGAMQFIFPLIKGFRI
ncbi:hypothetical protein RAC89_29940 [Paenibacillus sp. GD4]|jgi:hypothetical protein|uniref:hypothetical protein n=1 Tax=Paenibacillus sp. GD4 TaxID=3068890 RepID=UPI002796B2B8|nr:hypothetical protein [Paenibacillus sp. GD4]MDQ1914605.1 hypothetical protein [Paenibacillus sp. GD4]